MYLGYHAQVHRQKHNIALSIYSKQFYQMELSTTYLILVYLIHGTYILQRAMMTSYLYAHICARINTSIHLSNISI